MTVQSAVLFGFGLGITLFILYLSLVTHSDQWSAPKEEDSPQTSLPLISTSSTAQTAQTGTEEMKIVSLSPAEISLIKKDLPIPPPPSPPPPPQSKQEDSLLSRIKQEKLSKYSELSPKVSCLRMKRKFHVVPNHSWGTLPIELQQKWGELNCDSLVPKEDQAHTHQEEETTTTSGVEPVDSQPPPSALPKEEEETAPMGIDKDSDEEWCWSNRKKYKVQPMKSWGHLPLHYIDLWKQRNCDAIFTRSRLNKMPIANCGHIPNHLTDESLPLIAIMAATTTRKITNPSTKKLALFNYLLPSIARTIDCGFRYEYTLGYDQGDPYYDSEAGMREVQTWFQQHMVLPLQSHQIAMRLRLVKVNNHLKKPGPVFLEMARAAYEDGAQYFYRVNDDTEFLSHWPQLFVATIQSLSVPYGVVGPLCNQGNEKILTHDFVHRTHMEIFEMNYYPPQLTDWWMDDWISFVYGQTRTFKARLAKVIHHIGAHGQRYQVDSSHERLLGQLIEQGRQQIRNYLLKHQDNNETILVKFDKDVYKAGFIHRDIPHAVQQRIIQQSEGKGKVKRHRTDLNH